MTKAKTIQAFLNLGTGDDSFQSVETIRKSDKTTKQKVVAYLQKLIKKHEDEITLWKKTIEYIQK